MIGKLIVCDSDQVFVEFKSFVIVFVVCKTMLTADDASMPLQITPGTRKIALSPAKFLLVGTSLIVDMISIRTEVYPIRP